LKAATDNPTTEDVARSTGRVDASAPDGARRLRVLHVLHTLARAGAEQLVYEMATANRSHMETAAVCLDREGPLADQLRNEGFAVHCTQRAEGLDRSQIGKIAGIIREFRPHVIHCHQYTPFFYGTLGRPRGNGGRILFTEHGRHFPDVVGWKRRWFNRLFLSGRAAHITAVCDFTRQRLIEKEGMPADRIEVVYNGVDVDRFASLPSPSKAKQDLGLPPDKLVILQVGTFRAVKDQPTAIRAFAHVLRTFPEAIMVFAGDGPILDECRKLASDLHLDNSVFFLGSRQDIPQVLAAADLMLMTSLSEAHSVSLLEGMAARLPIVATRVGGIPETVVDGQTGLLAPAGKPEDMARCMVRLLGDPDARRSMGQAGYDRVKTQFLRSRMHRRYLEIYREMAQGVQP
jgi:L-malate glycosyltransferase